MEPLTEAMPVEELVLATEDKEQTIPKSSIKEISGSLVYPSLGNISLASLLILLLGVSGWWGWKNYKRKTKTEENNDYNPFR